METSSRYSLKVRLSDGAIEPSALASGAGWSLKVPEGGWTLVPGRNSVPTGVRMTAPDGICLTLAPEPDLWKFAAFEKPPTVNPSGVLPDVEIDVEMYSEELAPVVLPPGEPIARVVPSIAWTGTLPVSSSR